MNTMPFDNNKYIQIQEDAILNRIQNYERLYIEVGGKIFDDYHASRVLPGFEPNVKIQILQELKNDLEIISSQKSSVKTTASPMTTNFSALLTVCVKLVFQFVEL